MVKVKAMCVITSIFLGVSLLFMVGCATKVAPTEDLLKAEMAIKEAEAHNATMNAPLEMKLANEKLTQAKAEVEKEQFEKARQLAEEALYDAKYAEAKSRSEKAKKSTQDLKDSIQTLRQEIERAQQRNR